MRPLARSSKGPSLLDRGQALGWRGPGPRGEQTKQKRREPGRGRGAAVGGSSISASLVAAAPATPAGGSGSPAPCGRRSSSDRNRGRSVDLAAPTAGQGRVRGCSLALRMPRDCLHRPSWSWGTRTGRKHRSLPGAGTGSAAAVAASSGGVDACSSLPGHEGSGRCSAFQPGRRG